MLTQGGLASRVAANIPTLTPPSMASLNKRVPPRLSGSENVVKVARAKWMSEVGSLLALHAAKERCEALGLLVLLRYMPVHHTALPESLNPLSDLLTAQSGMEGAADAPSALYSVIVGEHKSTLGQLFDALLPLLANRPDFAGDADPPHAIIGAGPCSRSYWEQRAQQLATVAIMAAMHGEKDLCQLQLPAIARTPAAADRHRELTADLLHCGQTSMADLSTATRGALGALLITWCVVI
jgi:hypothetical protein